MSADLFIQLIWPALLATLWMSVASAALALFFGLPLGILLNHTHKQGLKPCPIIYISLGFIVDSLRAIPFIILAAFVTPLSRLMLGQAYGINVVIFILVLSAVPFYARIAELALRTVDPALLKALRSMGATHTQIIKEVLLPEAFPSLISGFTVTFISILSATSLAGYLGGGGLGDLAVRYGYQRYAFSVMFIIIIIMIILNLLVQALGNHFTYKAEIRRGK